MGIFSRKPKVKQLGTIFVKPSEAKEFKDKSKITIVKTSGGGSGLDQIPRGDISKILQKQEAQRIAIIEKQKAEARQKAEIEKQKRLTEERKRIEQKLIIEKRLRAGKLASMEKAKRFAYLKQRQTSMQEARLKAELRNVQIKQEQSQIKQFRAMSHEDRQRHVREQAEKSKAWQLQKIQDMGKTLTPESAKLLEKVKTSFVQNKKINPKEWFKEVVDRASEQKMSVKNYYKKFPATIKLERFYFDKLKLNEKKYRAFQTKLYGMIDKYEKTKFYKTLKNFVGEGAERISTIQYLPAGMWNILKHPTTLITEVPKNILVDYAEMGQLIKTSPSKGLGRFGGEIVLWQLTGGVFKIVGKVGKKASMRLSPYFKSFEKGVITIKVPKEIFIRRGQNIFLKSRITKTSFVNKVKAKLKKKIKSPTLKKKIKVRRKGQFRKFQKTKGITLTKGLVKDIGIPLKEQITLAGTKGTLVSAQADRLVSFFRRKKIIRKPIPNEANFTEATKKLLKKFDEGKITKKEFYTLNQKVLKESGKTMLERCLFADPKGIVRFTRISGGVGEASLKDIFRGNVTFKKMKPQILVVPEGQIAKFPKSVKKIIDKLKAKKTLTEFERAKLVKWTAMKKSAEWKLPGDIRYKGGKEPEVLFNPKGAIQRVKKLATTEIDGVKVDITQIKTIHPSQMIKKIIKKSKIQIITQKELSKLKNYLSKKGIKINPAKLKKLIKKKEKIKKKFVKRRDPFKPKPYFPIKRTALAKLKYVIKGARTIPKRKPTKRKPKKRIPRKPTPRPKPPIRPTPRPPTRIRPPIKPRPTPRPPTRIRPPIRPRPPIKPLKDQPPIIPKDRKKIIKAKPKKKIKVYNVYARPLKRFKKQKRPKLIRINKVPLSRSRAKDLRNFILDTSLARTGRIKPTRGKVGKSKLRVPVGYSGQTRHKFRSYRIVKGKRKLLVKGKLIEKSKRLLDTRQEKKKITLKRRITQIKKPKIIKRKKTIKKTKLQRGKK